MTKPLIIASSLLSMLLCLSCGGSVMETKLNGFDQGKLTMKFNYILHNAKTDAGEKAYRLETLVHHAIGTKSNLKTERESILHEDFTLIETNMTRMENKNQTKFSAKVDNGRIITQTEATGSSAETKELSHIGPIYIELHPLLYFNDLTKPGDSKTYPILTDKSEIASVEIRYVGEAQFYEDNKAQQSKHFKIQAVTSLDEYDDYYLDPKTGNILKIEFGYLKFVPSND